MHISRNDIKGNYSEEFITSICFRVAETGDFLAFAKNTCTMMTLLSCAMR